MKQYELLVVLPGTVEESGVPTLIGSVKDIVEKHGGENIVMQDRGKSRLAYPIRHIRYGYFHLIRFSGEGETVPKIQKELSMMGELLRSLITIYDPKQRAETQKKLGRTEDGPMRTLASVFERFGGDVSKPVAARTPKKEAVAEKKTSTPIPTENEATKESVAPAEEEEKDAVPVIPMEDIDKKLDQLLEDDLKQV